MARGNRAGFTLTVGLGSGVCNGGTRGGRLGRQRDKARMKKGRRQSVLLMSVVGYSIVQA